MKSVSLRSPLDVDETLDSFLDEWMTIDEFCCVTGQLTDEDIINETPCDIPADADPDTDEDSETPPLPSPAEVVAALEMPALLDGYAHKDIFNTDDTGLYYRALPNRSLVIKVNPRKGIKTSKERMTVLLACSAAGEKLTPLVIGKALNPRCFCGVDKGLLPVTYRANRKHG